MPDDLNQTERLIRLERMLEEITHQLNGGGQALTDRVEKIIVDKLEPVRDIVRDNKTRLTSIESSRTWNLPGAIAVLGAVFGILTWFINDSAESTKSGLRNDFDQKLNSARNVLNEKLLALESNFRDVDARFKSNTELRNTQFSEQQRTNHVLWNAMRDSTVKLPEYPSGPYFQPTGP